MGNYIVNILPQNNSKMLKIRSSQTIDPHKSPKFHEIKQLEYFKQIIRKVQDPHLKQILPSYITKLLTKDLDHNKYIYIPDRTIDECPAGCVIDVGVGQLSRKMWIYRLDRKVDQILRNVLNIQMPVLRELRISDRFAVLTESIVENYAFNRTIYRKGEQFMGIYFIIEGEIKIIHDKTTNPIKLVSKHNYIGLEQLQKQYPNYINTILSNCNGTQLLFISIESINKIRENSQLTLRELYSTFDENQQEGIIIMEDVRKIRERNQLQSRKINRVPLQLNTFVRKCDQFMKFVNKTDKGFNDYLKSKKMMLQLRESMTAAKINRKNNQNKQFRILNMDQLSAKSSKLNTNLLTCRSQLLKQNILKRLEISKNSTRMELTQIFSQSLNIEIPPNKKQ